MNVFDLLIQQEYGEAFSEKNDLNDAFSLDLGLYLNHQSEDAVEEILRDIKLDSSYHKSTQKRRLEALKCILGNLLKGTLLDKPIRYSKKPKNYSAISSVPDWYTYNIVVPIFNGLKKYGLIREFTGFMSEEVAYQTRAKSTQELNKFFWNNKISPSCITFSEMTGREVRLKQKNGNNWKEVEYKDTTDTLKWKKELREYNKAIDSSEISLIIDQEHKQLIQTDQFKYSLAGGRIKINNQQTNHTEIFNIPTFINSNEFGVLNFLSFGIKDIYTLLLTGKESHFTQELQQVMIESQEQDFVLCREHLHRIFNGSWSSGGRFYGPTYQRFSEDLRKYIHIDSEPTIEKDYVATHLNLAMNLEGYKVTRDPYLNVCDGNPESRNAFKNVAYVVLYSADRVEATRALNKKISEKELSLPEGMTTKDAIDKFIAAFPELVNYLFKGAGLDLQACESAIMNRIIQRLLNKGILALTIHDSVIVQKQYVGTLEQVMEEEYEKTLYGLTGKNFRPMIK